MFASNVRMKTQMARSYGAAPQSKEEHISEIGLKLSVLIQCMMALVVVFIAAIVINKIRLTAIFV